ncbi:multiple resistance and pH regulation protein F [Alkalicaulis satelles]|uniref:Multiple resistance and pH regulation protein F n=2 Tax=Alkalicaulis satelles TaxID=2609175 RepID=A0A5M6ZD50_9PROT|nr:multiple resistance and pH regulation protein F [Alkalicaulis satelles]
MADLFMLAALGVLISMAGALWRAWRGPGRADRMMSAQLIGAGGVGLAVLIAAAREEPAILDVALVLALLAAFAALAFVKTVTVQGAGDPESEEDPAP